MDMNKIGLLNQVYEALQIRREVVLNELKKRNYSYKWGYYGGHSIKHREAWILEKFPIPVITVEGLCDVGIDLGHTFVEYKLLREKALEFDFTQLEHYEFEVYGIENYLQDFYNATLNIEEIHTKILNSNEEEIGISLFLNPEEKVEYLIGILEQLKTA